MSSKTAQQVYEDTRGSNSPENKEKYLIKKFGHKKSATKAFEAKKK